MFEQFFRDLTNLRNLNTLGRSLLYLGINAFPVVFNTTQWNLYKSPKFHNVQLRSEKSKFISINYVFFKESLTMCESVSWMKGQRRNQWCQKSLLIWGVSGDMRRSFWWYKERFLVIWREANDMRTAQWCENSLMTVGVLNGTRSVQWWNKWYEESQMTWEKSSNVRTV